MTALKPIYILPDSKDKRTLSGSFFNKMYAVKSSYSQLNKFLRLGEALAPAAATSLLYQPQKIIKEQLGLLTIPGFIGSTRRFYTKLSALCTLGKVEALKGSVLPTLSYAQSSCTLLHYVHTLRLVDISSALKPLSAINGIARLILCAHSFFKQVKRQIHSFTPTRKEGFLFFRNLLNFYSAVFFLLTFLLNLTASPYWMLAVSSFLLIAALVDSLLKFVLD